MPDDLDAQALAVLQQLTGQLDDLAAHGVTPVAVFDDAYPARLRERLGAAAPPVLCCAGDTSLLDSDGIGVVGSRAIGDDAADATRQVASHIAGAGLSLVSGGSPGVDTVAMAAALEAGGTVVGVLADSLLRAVRQREHRTALLDGRACLCTPYHPDVRYTSGAAMGRNKVIFGLSRATLVIACARGQDSTWDGATEALEHGYGRVAVWTGLGAGPDNAALVDAGGIAVDEPQGVLDLDPVDPAATTDDDRLDLGVGDDSG